jgi:hypothetical protein
MSISWAKGFVPYYEKRKASDYLKIVDAVIGASSGTSAGMGMNAGGSGSALLSGPSASVGSTSPDRRTLNLTRANSSEARAATITAPGRGSHNFNLFSIDAREFDKGGTLIIDIDIPRGSATDGSFALFSGDAPVEPQSSTRPLTGSYDVRRGSSTRLKYQFSRGQRFILGMEGNWFSPKGATGTVQFRAYVKAAQGGRLEPSAVPGAPGSAGTAADMQAKGRPAASDLPTNSASQDTGAPANTPTPDRPPQGESQRSPGVWKVNDATYGPFNSMVLLTT